MACYFFDIDGTIVNYHTSEWLDGAKEYLQELNRRGNTIVFVTMRDHVRDRGTAWSVEKTNELLGELGFPYHILFNIPSPRYIFDDRKVKATQKKANTDWWDELELLMRG